MFENDKKDKHGIPLSITIPICYWEDENDKYQLETDFLIDTFSDKLKSLQKEMDYLSWSKKQIRRTK